MRVGAFKELHLYVNLVRAGIPVKESLDIRTGRSIIDYKNMIDSGLILVPEIILCGIHYLVSNVCMSLTERQNGNLCRYHTFIEKNIS